MSSLAALGNFWMFLWLRLGHMDRVVSWGERAGPAQDLMPMSLVYHDMFLAPALLFLGRAAESEEVCKRLEARLVPDHGGIPGCWAWHTRAMRQLGEGNVAGASDLYRRIEGVFNRMGIGEPCVVPWGRHAIAAHLGAGRADDAKRVLAWFEEAADRLPCRWVGIVAAVGRCQIAARDGDLAKAEGEFAAAMSLHGDLDLPLERAETLLTFARILRHGGHPLRSRPLLREAAELAGARRCRWLESMALDELAVAGGRRGRRYSLELTAQEERVASQAAEGRSNRQIAAVLQLSVSTVETHLERIYAKLGIHSRRELMTRRTRTERA